MAKLQPEQIEQMIRWRERGWSCNSIAKRLGVSTGAINYQCLKNGAISPRQKGKTPFNGPTQFTGKDGRTFRRFSEDDDAQMRELAHQGKTAGQIAREMGRGTTSIRMRMLLLGAHEEIAALF